MHIDARNLDNNTLIEGDICIIGTGAAGISCALEMLNTPYKVILLEGGGFDYDDKVQDLYGGTTTGQHYYPLKSSFLHTFGGTTGHWGGMCSTFDPFIFEKRDWVPGSGWPIKYDELDSYYKRAHVNLDLGLFEYDIKYWQKQDGSLKELPLNKEVIWNKVWRFSAPTRFGAKYKDTIVNAKNIHLYTYANAVDIVGNENISEIKEVVVKNYAGKTHRVQAKQFIFACSAVQNARVMLAANKQSAKGVGNDNDLVGRYFMEHLEVRSAELWLKDANALRLYMTKPPKIRGELSIQPKILEKHGILNGICTIAPLFVSKKSPAFIDLWNSDDPRENLKDISVKYEEAKGGKMEKLFESDKHKGFQLIMRLEQAPNPDSRITLKEEKDGLGMPRINMNWGLTAFEKKSIRKIYEIIAQEVGIAGIGRVRIQDGLLDDTINFPRTTSGGWHHMGTTRMHDDPKQGVTDKNCKVHGIANMYMAGSSNFPNASAVNPTLTTVAVSIRLADHVKEKMKG